MARKTFISYKYSEAKNLRDKIVDKMGKDAQYYRGETSDSPDLTDNKTETIRKKLKDMIFDTTVTIVIISPNMIDSNWIDWEIEYSLKEVTRNDRTSKTNGILGVVMKYNGGYSWLRPQKTHDDGCVSTSTNDEYLYDIIIKNRFNQDPVEYSCDVCETVNSLTGSYIAMVNEEDFLADIDKYIENAYEKSQKLDNYIISKER